MPFCKPLSLRITKNMIKYTQNTLDKLEAIPEQCGYILRYERGNFQSGYCILDNKKVVVLNKFLQTEGRINALIEIIPQLNIDTEMLDDNAKKLFAEISERTDAGEGEA
jgi:uncharacterized cysteine cluster protein YcgN (CxxCxxCC family)